MRSRQVRLLWSRGRQGVMDIRDRAVPCFPLPPLSRGLCSAGSTSPGACGLAMWGSSLIAWVCSSVVAGVVPARRLPAFPPGARAELGPRVGPSRSPLVKQLPSCPAPQGSTWHSAVPGQLMAVLSCLIVPVFSSEEFTTPSHLSGRGECAVGE